MKPSSIARALQVSIFSVAFSFVETAVVVYLRAMYYPEGFSFPLKMISPQHYIVELGREFSTIVMLIVIGFLAGSSRWQRFGYFMIAFGVWDIFYYIWLKVILQWPTSLFDPDILFLLPIPWLGPVIAPVVISLLMIVAGVLIIRKEEQGEKFHPPISVWIAAVIGTGAILCSFMLDTDASLRMKPLQPYHYELFVAGVFFYLVALYIAFRSTHKRDSTNM